MTGPYCRFCSHRCFVDRVLADGRPMLLATCPAGMEHDRRECGQDHTTARNPYAGLTPRMLEVVAEVVTR